MQAKPESKIELDNSEKNKNPTKKSVVLISHY